MCFNNVVSILNRSYVKKTNDINTVNRVKSDTEGVFTVTLNPEMPVSFLNPAAIY